MHAATLAPMSSPLPAGTVIAVYSMECELSAGPRIVRYFEADESDIAGDCFGLFTSQGRVMNYAVLSYALAEQACALREAAIDLAFDTRHGHTSPEYLDAQETAWSFLGRALHPSTWP